MASLFDDYLLAQPIRKRELNVYYVTDLCKQCLRQAYLDITQPAPQPVETLRIFEAGRVLEKLWVEKILPERYEVISTQLPARYTCLEFSIHGRVDALCQHEGASLVVHECKTAKSLFYTTEPKKEHVQQLQFYLNALNVEFGSIDYLDKSILLQGSDKSGGGQVDRCFTVKRDPSTFALLVSKCKELAKFINTDTLPDASSRDWFCDYCQHKESCSGGTQ